MFSILCTTASYVLGSDKHVFMGERTNVVANFLTICRLTLNSHILHDSADKSFIFTSLSFLCTIKFRYKDYLRTYNTCNGKDP